MHPADAERKYLELLKGMPGFRRIMIGAELYEMAREFVAAGVRRQYPDADEHDLKEKLKERMR